jgi:septal ring factor EnvC (AmiA/AmiB activator)
LAVAAAGFLYYEITSLHERNALLTLKLDAAMETVAKVEQHSKQVSDATLRLEKLDEERVKQLRAYERSLNTLSKQNEEFRVLLSTSVPDELLRGLRCYTPPRDDAPAKGTASPAGAP